MENSLQTADAKLQDTLSKLSIAESRVHQLEEECTSSRTELKKSQSEVQNLKLQKEVDSQRLLELENSFKSINSELSESQRSLIKANSQMQEKQIQLDSALKEVEALKHKIDHLQESSEYDLGERSSHLENIKSLQSKVHILEEDNKELARKVCIEMNSEDERLHNFFK